MTKRELLYEFASSMVENLGESDKVLDKYEDKLDDIIADEVASALLEQSELDEV